MATFAAMDPMFVLPTFRESVDKAVSAENLQAAAAKATDPQVLLGLAILAPTGSPVRRNLSEMAVKAKPDYDPILAVLAITMDRPDEMSVGELIKRDPDNALGYYVQGNLLHGSDRDTEALESFRKAVACPELRLYDPTTGQALFNALDALSLQGRDRLCALSWMASRTSNFSSSILQSVSWTLSELAQRADPAIREEISELLLGLAGHLYTTNFHNRWFAQRALERAFGLKAELAAAGKTAKKYGYAAAIHGLFSAIARWPGFEHTAQPMELAQYLPSRIHRAFAVVDPSKFNAGEFGYEMNLKLPDSDKAAFEKAKENAIQAAAALLEAALTDPDGIVGPYLKGVPQSANHEEGRHLIRHLIQHTLVEKLMNNRPDLFKAAAANEEAMMALWRAGDNDPGRANMSRMMQVGWQLLAYASSHDSTFPDSIDLVLEQKSTKPPIEAKSLITGKPYIYVAAGEKMPIKSSERAQFVVLYDDNAAESGYYQCVTGAPMGTAISVDHLKEQLRKRGK